MLRNSKVALQQLLQEQSVMASITTDKEDLSFRRPAIVQGP